MVDLLKIAFQTKWTLARALNAKNLSTNATAQNFASFLGFILGPKMT
jgi:hypothetical protein